MLNGNARPYVEDIDQQTYLCIIPPIWIVFQP